MLTPYSILSRKRNGSSLSHQEVAAVVRGAVEGAWTDAQLGAFLMAVAIGGMDDVETRALTEEMLDSGERWSLGSEIPTLADKHSTGGVGDKVSLVIAPLLAACGQPIVMLTGRGLGHTAGTADKLEAIDGLRQDLTREQCVELLDAVQLAIGVPTEAIAPADRILYAIRDTTGTVDSIPLMVASILSKKLATGAAAVVFDVKVGNGAFISDTDRARELARLLVATSCELGTKASALLTDMSQPLGNWVGHRAEVAEAAACLDGAGPADLMEVVYELASEAASMTGVSLDRSALEGAIASGVARQKLVQWVEAQSGDPRSIPKLGEGLAPEVYPIAAQRTGVLATVDTRRVGLILAGAGAGRVKPTDAIDLGVSLEYRCRIGEALGAGDEIARVFLREPDDEVLRGLHECFAVADEAEPPALIHERISA